MASTMEEKKKRRCPIHDLALAATKQVWTGPAGEEKKRQGRQNLHTCSSSNRASIALAANEQVWMVSEMGSLNPHMRGTLCWMKIPVLLHQKSNATSTCFGFWLKEEETPFLSYRGEEISLAFVSLTLTGPF